MSKNKKVLAISIDGVLRDLYTQFDYWYRKVYIKNDSLVQMDDNFNYVESNNSNEDEELKIQKEIDKKITFPLDTFDLLNHYFFESREDLNNFLYTDYPFEIFASANSYPKTMDSINFLQIFGENSNLFDVVLYAKCKDGSIVSTFHFLAKQACKIKNIKFIEEHYEVWDFADVVITDCPEVFETKPENKKVLKINHLYNTYSESDYSFESINEIKNKEFIENLFK
jgi:hypothetical protein